MKTGEEVVGDAIGRDTRRTAGVRADDVGDRVRWGGLGQRWATPNRRGWRRETV